jgi:hypothetical protein
MIRVPFEEAKHPRGFGGKFGHVTSGDSGVAKKAAAKRPAPQKVSSPKPSTPKPKRAPLEDGRVYSDDYGMHYSADNEKVVERARQVPKEKWDLLPIEMLPPGTPIEANEETLKRKHIDKVVSGEVPFREGYVNEMWRAPDGSLHVVDGHHRVAMYAALKKPMPVRIMDEASLAILKQAP